ncbi:hypothetical protein FB009_11785 [Sinorhizobium medicae]|uniref:DEAD/DEAH box helicase family protein n=1 Tax=Sinorhizobium medicae TaxID=110321 RepID=UPI00119B67CA|nr:DEAD/DEAH box helicase family protein [Sinorhizobium medicae]MQU78051.1 hypothetical protein [Sinorhizobium medicae]TWA34076.1 hypothetical protein FB009_11785 [Sinorhizobium medicae]
MKRTIQKVSGHIGAGKSRSTLQWYAELIKQNDGKPVPATLATPTNELSKQHRRYLSEMGIPCVVISQEEGFRSASEEYKRLCEEGYEGVLLVNHWVALTTATNTANRLLIIDEAFSPVDNIKIEFENAEELQDFTVKETDEPGFYELVPSEHTVKLLMDVQDKDGTRYRNFGKKAQELGEFTANTHYRVIIDQDSFNMAETGEAFDKYKKVILQFTTFMLPSIIDCYRDVLIISANIEKTLLSRMWSKDVTFKTNEFIESRLDYSDLSHKAECVELHHVPIPNLSKTFVKGLAKGKEAEGNQTFLNLVAEPIDEMFPGRPHIYCTNKHPREGKEYDWLLEAGTRVITNPHGWNHLQDCDMGVFLAAINFDPDTVERLFAFYGITADQSKEALCYQLVYQFLGRTSLRDKDSRKKVVLIVQDEGAAKNLQSLIPGCAPSTPLPIDFEERAKRGRPRIERTDEERKEYEKQKKRAQRAKKAAAAEMTI